MNLASISNCSGCGGPYFSKAAVNQSYCTQNCYELHQPRIDLEERVTELENKILNARKKTGIIYV